MHQSLLPLLACSLLSACQWGGGGQPVPVTFEFDGNAIRHRLKETSLSRVSCLFVTVTGDGISSDFSSLKLGARNPQCMGLGVTSSLKSLANLTASATRLVISAGSKRVVKIMGAETTVAACDGLALGDLFDKKRPAIFEIARAEVDVFTDKKVTISGTNDLSAATDVVAPCDGSVAGVEEELVPSGWRVAALYNNGGANRSLRMFNVDSTDYHLTNDPADDTAGSATSLVMNSRKRTFYAVRSTGRGTDGRPTPAFVLQFSVSPTGTITKGQGFELFHSVNSITFSEDDRFAYIASGDNIQQYATSDSGWWPLTPSACANPGFTLGRALGNRFFYFQTGIAWVSTYPNSGLGIGLDDGNRCNGATSDNAAGTYLGIAKHTQFFKSPDVAYVQTYQSPDYYSYEFGISPTGVLSNSGSPHRSNGFGGFAVTPDRKTFIYADTSTITSCGLKAVGGFPCESPSSLVEISPRAPRVDPFGKVVYYVVSTNLLKQALIGANHSLTENNLGSTGTSPGTAIDDLIIVPIY